MAHFAKLDENDIVTAVIVVDDAWLDDGGTESEAKGIAALLAWSGHPHWAQTSYNGNIRARYAGGGYTFDRVRDAFVEPQPFPSWTLDEATTSWVAPILRPDEGYWTWDEAMGAWQLVQTGGAP